MGGKKIIKTLKFGKSDEKWNGLKREGLKMERDLNVPGRVWSGWEKNRRRRKKMCLCGWRVEETASQDHCFCY